MDMKAGRELDALIAEKVMGWSRMTVAGSPPSTFPAFYVEPVYGVIVYLLEEGMDWDFTFSPSTNNADTVTMLETFTYYEITKVGHNEYAVAIWSDNGKEKYSEFGDTLGEAAGNAALKAVGYE